MNVVRSRKLIVNMACIPTRLYVHVYQMNLFQADEVLSLVEGRFPALMWARSFLVAPAVMPML